MDQLTIQDTVKNGLCCGCGVCKGICPRSCISWKKEHGLYTPLIDQTQCINCGLCYRVCPGLGHHYAPANSVTEAVTGAVLACHTARSKDSPIRHVAASGGVVSTIIQELLSKGYYEGAFCLDSYDYREQLQTRYFTANEVSACWQQSNTPKSRYLPVSHEHAVMFMKSHPSSRLILVGTSCAIRGLQAAAKALKLNMEQYLFLGLFCDQVFNYNILPYFEDTFAEGAPLKALHFKNKESGGWPGNLKLYPETGDPFYVSKKEREKAKPYFMPERCLYCVDKLNVCADISLGDNYTGIDDSPLGSNSVIIRTQKGLSVWDTVRDSLEIRNSSIEAIRSGQYLDGRMKNLYFSDIKSASMPSDIHLNTGIPRTEDYRNYFPAWKASKKQLVAGALYDEIPEQVGKQMLKDCKRPNPVIRILKRGLRYIKRRLK